MSNSKYLLLVSAFLLALFIYSCDDENADLDESVEISGYLVDGQGVAIPNTTIIARTLDQKATTIAQKRGSSLQAEEFTFLDSMSTDETGKFLLKQIPNDPETVFISIENDEYDIVNRALSDFNKPVEGDAFWYISIDRKAECNTALKLLFTETNGNGNKSRYTPDEEIKISLTAQNGDIIKLHPPKSTKFGDLIIDGELTYQNVCPGVYKLNVTRDEYEPIEDEITIEADGKVPTNTYNLVYTGLNEEDCCNNSIYIAARDEEGNSVEMIYEVSYEGQNEVDPLSGKVNGEIMLEDICNGFYTVKFSAEGYRNVQMSDSLVCNDTAVFVPKLTPIEDGEDTCCTGSLVLHLIDKDNMNQYVVDAKIKIVNKKDSVVGEYKSKAEPFKLDSLCEGSYSVIIEHDDYPPRTIIVEIKCDEITEKEVALKEPKDCCKGSISLLPRDSTSNDVVNGATFDLYFDGQKISNGKVENNLAVVFEGLCEGEYRIVFNHPKYGEIVKTIKIECNEKVEEEFFVNEEDCCKGKVSVKLETNPADSLRHKAFVIIKQGEKEVAGGELEIKNGVATWSAELCEGNYVIVIELDGFERIEREITIKCDEEIVFAPELVKEECCEGKFIIQLSDSVDNQIVPIKGAAVIVKKDGKAIEDPRTNEDGRAELELCEGNYVVVIEAEGYERIEHEFEIKCDETTEFVPDMNKEDDCCDGKIILNLFDKESGDRLDSLLANAKLKHKKGNVIREKKTDDGKIVWEELCEGEYTVVIEIEHYKTIEMTIKVKCGETFEENISFVEAECCKGSLNIHLFHKNERIKGAFIVVKQDGREVAKGESGKESWSKELCEGEYVVVIEADDFERIEEEIKIECDKETKFVPEMEKKEDCCNSTLRFVVKDADSNAVKDAEVRIWKGNEKVHIGKTNSDGVVEFDGVCQGDDYSYSVSKDGHKGAEREMEDIECKDSQSYHVILEKDSKCCNASLKFIVKDDNGDALEGAEIRIYIGDDKVHIGKTNSDGVVKFDEVCEGTRYSYSVEKDGFKEKEGALDDIDCKDSKTYEVKLEKDSKCCDASLKFTVKDKNGDPLDSAEVRIWKGNDKVHVGKTNKNGVVEFGDVCKGGDYSYSVKRDGYEGKEAEMDDIDCKDAHSYTVKLEDDTCCEATIKAIVYDKNTQEKIEGATVKLFLDGREVASGKTDADGIYKTDDTMCEGEYEIKITKTGYKGQENEWKIEDCKLHQESFFLEK
jgi:hypothetical protein